MMSRDVYPAARIPSATFRVQLNYLFTLRDALALVPYLYEIGISDLYASPVCKAAPKTLHGYDVVNPLEINPEIGTEEDFRRFALALKDKGMGLILDIVPNHMGIESPENIWWMDVLENGPGSVYAEFFDINWHPVKKELENRLLLPVLGDQYGNVLDRGELRLLLEEGSFFIAYYDHRFPLRPKSYLNVLGHRLEDLEGYGPEEEDFQEYLSILTAIRHLPLYTASDPYSIAERTREKEVVKRRLAHLRRKSSPICRFLDENVRIFNGVPGNSRSYDLFDRLLEQQIYRLAFWRVATEEINYRRFFDINQLAAIRVEKRRVFREYHRLIFQFVRERLVTGLRVDHPDGLYHPTRYFRRLQEECFVQLCSGDGDTTEGSEERLREEFRKITATSDYKPMYIVGEKILVKDERMPADWPIFGTTGYNFLNTVNGLFVATANSDRFRAIYSSFSGVSIDFEDIVYENKKLIMLTMSSEINMLGEYLNRISENDRHTRDFTLNSLTAAITEIIAVFPVYRTYIYQKPIDERDRLYVDYAIRKAKRKSQAVNSLVYDFIHDVLLLKFPSHLPEEDRREWMDFVMKFQQLTGPFMAKGMEDTSFYVYNPLVSLNEVGGSPDVFGITIEDFHRKGRERLASYPHTMLATSTHDSKRNEDVRARINVLSEMPDVWERALRRWSELNDDRRILVGDVLVPSRNEEYLLYQTMIGFSPVGPVDESIFEIYSQRLKDYMLKAAREAKVTTSWIDPDTEYESALAQFIEAVISRVPTNTFLYEFEQFIRRIEPYGLFNSLSQLLLKVTSPGVPDFYQGTMIWNFRLVDPDNRWPIDYSFRTKLLERMLTEVSRENLGDVVADLVANLTDGRIKLYVAWRALNFRRSNQALYDTGDYVPVEVAGERAENVCAFIRRAGDSAAMTVIPRFLTHVTDNPAELFQGEDVWMQSFLVLRDVKKSVVYRNVFTGEILKPLPHRIGAVLYLCDVFRSFPVALLEQVEKG